MFHVEQSRPDKQTVSGMEIILDGQQLPQHHPLTINPRIVQLRVFPQPLKVSWVIDRSLVSDPFKAEEHAKDGFHFDLTRHPTGNHRVQAVVIADNHSPPVTITRTITLA